MKTWKGKLLYKYTKGELIDILEWHMDQLSMLSSTQPEDLKKPDNSEDRFKPSKEDEWTPPRVTLIMKGKM